MNEQLPEGKNVGLEPVVGHWYPIDVAPRDRTQVLCAWITPMTRGRFDVCPTVHVLSWHENWDGDGIGRWVMDGDWLTHFVPDGMHETPPLAYGYPTHWSPIPPLPQPSAKLSGVSAAQGDNDE